MTSRAAGAALAAVIAFSALSISACRAKRVLRPVAASERPPIVLITIDTLRADRLGSYGSNRGLTPTLDRFARGAARFTAAVTQVPLTLPAHATILTGLYPIRNGVRSNDGHLAPGVPTLAEALRARGYSTAAFIGGYPLRAGSGLARGFDRYDDDFLRAPGVVERRADAVVQSALTWVGEHRAQPLFVWLHLFDPHSPYQPPAPFARAHAGAPYDGEVAYTDAAISRLFERLKQLDLFSRAAVFVMADHGESLGEHGERTHGVFLYDATIHVPLLVKLPNSAAASVIEVPVEAADLAPTIAALAGAALAGVNGRSLLPLMAGEAGDPERAVYTESYYLNILLGWSPLRAVRTQRWKFIEAPHPELYDLAQDPGERHNLAALRAALASGLQRALPSAAPAGAIAARGLAVSRESAERLRSLGYVSGSMVSSPDAGAVDPKDRVAEWADIENGVDETPRDPAAARRSFSHALQMDPGNGLAMKYLADLDFRAGRLDRARTGYRRAIAAGFRHPDAFVNLASIAERQGRPDEARASFADALAIDPSDADAWNRLGLLDAQRGSLNAAREAFMKSIASAPHRAEPYYNLAIIERRAGNEAAAQARLEEALARNPGYPEASYELGTGYLRAHQPGAALTAYRAALEARPDYPEALFGAAGAALELGAMDEARRDYKRFIHVAPSEYGTQVAAAREALRRLEDGR